MTKNRYSTNTSDYNVGDSRTANDTYDFLLLFFQMYPQFASNPFWVCGRGGEGRGVGERKRRGGKRGGKR